MFKKNPTKSIFSTSLLDIIFGAMGIFLLISVLTLNSERAARLDSLELQRQSVELQGQVDALDLLYEQSVSELQTARITIEGLEETRRTLREELQQLTAINQNLIQESGQFLLAAVSWDSADTDIDLHITDPQGARFSYLDETVSNRPGRLLKDTQNAPGLELWFTPIIEPGTYQVRVVRYLSPAGVTDIPIEVSLQSQEGITDIGTVLYPQRPNGTCEIIAHFVVDAALNTSIDPIRENCPTVSAEPKS